MDLHIRRASEADADRIAEIYNWYVKNTVVTFETAAVSPDEMRDRICEKLAQFDCVVGEFNHRIVGYAYYITALSGPEQPTVIQLNRRCISPERVQARALGSGCTPPLSNPQRRKDSVK
jgi:hypothetical protein